MEFAEAFAKALADKHVIAALTAIFNSAVIKNDEKANEAQIKTIISLTTMWKAAVIHNTCITDTHVVNKPKMESTDSRTSHTSNDN